MIADDRVADDRIADGRIADPKITDDRITDDRIVDARIADDRIADDISQTTRHVAKVSVANATRDQERSQRAGVNMVTTKMTTKRRQNAPPL